MIEKFEKYHNDLLSAEEKTAFEAELNSSPSIKEEYDIYLMMNDHLGQSINIDSALSNLDEIHNEKPKTKTLYFSLMRYAAIALCVIGATYFLWSPQNESQSPQELFATHYKPASISFATKGTVDDKIKAIDLAYKSGSFNSVIALIDNLPTEVIDLDNRITLAKGNAYLSAQKYDDAIATLEKLKDNSQFENEYYYYSGMAHLGKGNTVEAKRLFSLIPSSSNYSKKALNILSHLE